jgi:hypothetical protein
MRSASGVSPHLRFRVAAKRSRICPKTDVRRRTGTRSLPDRCLIDLEHTLELFITPDFSAARKHVISFRLSADEAISGSQDDLANKGALSRSRLPL